MKRFFTTTADGNLATHVGDDPTAVERNRLRLAKTIGLNRDQLRFMNQVHGNNVVIAKSSEHRALEADGMVTNEAGLALIVLVADCIPVLLDSPEGVIGAVHVGRKGLVNGAAIRTVEAMRAIGATRINAYFGPAICGTCYEVPETMRRDVSALIPESFSTTSEGRPALDIRAGLAAELARYGVSATLDRRCTKESPELYSFRRDRETGRFAGVIIAS